MLENFDKAVNDNKAVNDRKPMDSLEFWKKNVTIFASLAVLAKKYLSVQASSSACERFFSLSGHIFSCKRRRQNKKLLEFSFPKTK